MCNCCRKCFYKKNWFDLDFPADVFKMILRFLWTVVPVYISNLRIWERVSSDAARLVNLTLFRSGLLCVWLDAMSTPTFHNIWKNSTCVSALLSRRFYYIFRTAFTPIGEDERAPENSNLAYLNIPLYLRILMPILRLTLVDQGRKNVLPIAVGRWCCFGQFRVISPSFDPGHYMLYWDFLMSLIIGFINW